MGNNNYSYRSTENENDYYTGTYIGGRKHGKGILKTKEFMKGNLKMIKEKV